MRNIKILDNYKSHLSNNNITKFKSEITKQENSPVCSECSTFEIAKAGTESMKKDKFRLIKEKFDV